MTLRSRAWSGLVASILAASSAAAATPFDELIKPELNNSACFTRVYDAAHLRQHPKQKITAMTVWLKYVEIGGGASGLALSVSLGIIRRGDPDTLYSDGGCGWDDKANRDT